MNSHEFARQLLAKPESQVPETLAKRLLEPKNAGHTGTCWCGCGQETKSRFYPGHDSRFHGLAKRVARGEEPMPESFVCDEAKADFLKWHDAEKPKADAAAKAKADKAAEKAKAKAEASEPETSEELETV